MFIIEGSDHLGKTCIANSMLEIIKKRSDLPIPAFYSHMSKPNQYFDFFYNYTQRMSKYAIQDRFHLGALVWEKEGVLPTCRRKVIEGQILALGGFTLIVYSSDDKWYSEWLLENPKAELYDHRSLVEANKKYAKMVQCREVYFDDVWDVQNGVWPNEGVLFGWLTNWFERLEASYD